MSQTINGNNNIPLWMSNTVQLVDSFESEIIEKNGPNPHYPGPIHNIGGLHTNSHCRIPGIQPFLQPIIQTNVYIPPRITATNHCFQYGTTTHFPLKCRCGGMCGNVCGSVINY